MPVPEIDRLAHEILDILGGDLPHGQRPNYSWRLTDRARVAISRKASEVYATHKPLDCGIAERLQACYLRLQQLATVRDDPTGEFQTRPVSAFFGLYAALERAEMQERATPTPNLGSHQEAALPLRGRPDHDMAGHGADGTTREVRRYRTLPAERLNGEPWVQTEEEA